MRTVTFAAIAPMSWHRPDFAEVFLNCGVYSSTCRGWRYAVVSMRSPQSCRWGCAALGGRSFQAGHATAIEEATRWWIAAARQGCWPALDNLVASAWERRRSEQTRRGVNLSRRGAILVEWSHGMPVYGPEFVQELRRRFYGRVVTASD